jgi:hypothetical protein
MLSGEAVWCPVVTDPITVHLDPGMMLDVVEFGCISTSRPVCFQMVVEDMIVFRYTLRVKGAAID